MSRPTADAWGSENTRFFFDLTPDRVLEAVEASGLRCTGRCTALNSFENRVYEVELDPEYEDQNADAFEEQAHLSSALKNRRVVKFYRPGRWSQEQILEEHQFLLELNEQEIPAIAPLRFLDGQTLHQSSGIWYAVFPKVGGRSPDEFSDEQLLRIGRLLGRIHGVGAARKAKHRIELTPANYGIRNLESLLAGNWIPLEFRSRYEDIVRKICEISERLFRGVPLERIHGDCHPGNLLWNQAGPFFLDFDDMVRGPAVQDLWLLTPDRELLIEGYSEMRAFDRSTLKLIEPLRALRFVHFSAWIARRWDDPAFPQAFPHFNTHRYWTDETHDLEEQLRQISVS